MKKEILLDNKKVLYILRKSKRARKMRLALHVDGAITVTTPLGIPVCFIEKFMQEKSKWLLSKIEYFKKFKNTGGIKYDKAHYIKYKKDALNLVLRRIERFDNMYGFSYARVSVRNQKTRWGSCSRKRNLNFNYKILFLPEALQDYIIVHELCHLKEFNHSHKFWDLVAKTCPNHMDMKKELKERGLCLR